MNSIQDYVYKIAKLDDQVDFESHLESDRSEISALICSTILSTNLFKKNIELKTFSIKIFKGLTKYDFDKEYLYKTRTTLLAKIIREIYKLDIDACKLIKKRLLVEIDKTIDNTKYKKSFENSKQYSISTEFQTSEKMKPKNSRVVKEKFSEYWVKGINNLDTDNKRRK